MLQSLRRIVQEVNSTRDLDQVLEIIVLGVKTAIDADVCSVYLLDDSENTENKFTLMATDGLNSDLIGQVNMGYDAGLVGLVAQRADPLSLDDAQQHPRFQLVPGLNEEKYHSFVGIPITHHKNVLGVLVIQSEPVQHFSQYVVNFLVTIAAQLAGAITNAQASIQVPAQYEQQIKQQRVVKTNHKSLVSNRRPLIGQPGAPGVVIGEAVSFVSSISLEAIPDKQATDIEDEIHIFHLSLEAVRRDIKSLSQQLISDGMAEEDVAIFDAYLLMLNSKSLTESIDNKIYAGNWAAGALRDTILEHVNSFNELENPYLRERAKDIQDLGQMLYEQMQVDKDHPLDVLSKDKIIVAEDLSATVLADIKANNIAGIVLKSGSRTSHVAILARALGVPTVVGVSELPTIELDGSQLIVDGYSGQVFISPPESIINEYTHLIFQEKELFDKLKTLRKEPATTIDGVNIPLYANTGLVADITPSKKSGAEGIGLYRTEYPFMIRQQFPGEEEQSQIYHEVMSAFAPRPVVLRTLDIGGDKSLSYFPIKEDNPFLGWRGIRVTLDHPEIFMIQLRSMMIASIGLNNLNILFPMISSINELEDALELLERAYRELLNEDYKVQMPKVGVMVEVPSMIFQMRRIASLVDFVSIGSNDLIQYLLAVDRNNNNVANLYESLHPSVLIAIRQVIDEAHKEGVPVSICGEMASDPLAVILLLGMSIDSLSTSVASLPSIKWLIRNFSQQEAKILLDDALKMKDAKLIKSLLSNTLEKKRLGGLIRAGG